MSLIISFRGLDADRHVIEAYTGSESLAGISRSLALVANYAATGVIRQRIPFSDAAQFYIEALSPGSLNVKYAGIVGSVALGLSINGLYDLAKLTFNYAIGQEVAVSDPAVQELNKNRGGDIEALVEAIEPALKRGHYSIGRSVNEIVIINGDSNKVIVNFDDASKSYLESSAVTEEDLKDVSVSSLNANDKTGRVYFFDLGRTVPFKIASEAHPRTIGSLSTALDGYAKKTGATVSIKFERVEAPDGRLKRIIIYDAYIISGLE